MMQQGSLFAGHETTDYITGWFVDAGRSWFVDKTYTFPSADQNAPN